MMPEVATWLTSLNGRNRVCSPNQEAGHKSLLIFRNVSCNMLYLFGGMLWDFPCHDSASSGLTIFLLHLALVFVAFALPIIMIIIIIIIIITIIIAIITVIVIIIITIIIIIVILILILIIIIIKYPNS